MRFVVITLITITLASFDVLFLVERIRLNATDKQNTSYNTLQLLPRKFCGSVLRAVSRGDISCKLFTNLSELNVSTAGELIGYVDLTDFRKIWPRYSWNYNKEKDEKKL